MRHMRILVGAMAIGLAGCAGMSENECAFSDWRAVGYEDGARGASAESFGRYRKGCADHGVQPDFAAYQSGREAGLREYCQASRGHQEGARGATYHGVCPADSEARFLEAYNDARALYDLESGLRDADRRIRANEARMNEIELELTGKVTSALGSATSNEERTRLVVRTQQLAEERARLKSENKDLQARRTSIEKQLAAAREELQARR